MPRRRLRIVAAHSRDREPQRRAERIRDAAARWARFWLSRFDLDALAWKVAAMLDDIVAADQRQADATRQAIGLWRGIGLMIRSTQSPG